MPSTVARPAGWSPPALVEFALDGAAVATRAVRADDRPSSRFVAVGHPAERELGVGWVGERPAGGAGGHGQHGPIGRRTATRYRRRSEGPGTYFPHKRGLVPETDRRLGT